MEAWLERLQEALADVEPVSPRRQEALEGMAERLHDLASYRLHPILFEGEEALPGTRRAVCTHDDDGALVLWVHTEDGQTGLVRVLGDEDTLGAPIQERGVWRDRALAVWGVVQDGSPPVGAPDPYGLSYAQWHISDASLETEFPIAWHRSHDLHAWSAYNATVARMEAVSGGPLREDLLSDVELETVIARVGPVMGAELAARKKSWDEAVAESFPARVRGVLEDIGAEGSSRVAAHLRGALGRSLFEDRFDRDAAGRVLPSRLAPPQGTYTCDAVLAERRMQAFESYPFAASALMGDVLSPVVDAALPLAGPLARTLDVEPALVRRLAGVPASVCGLRYTEFEESHVNDDRRLVLEALYAVDPNHVPTDATGWKHFTAAAEVTHHMMLAFGGDDDWGSSTPHPMAALRGRYDIAARLNKHGAAQDFWDYADGLRSKVYVPAVAYLYAQQGLVLEDEERDAAFKARPFDLGWPRVPEAFAMSARYHHNLPALDDALPPLAAHMARAWQPLIGQWDAGGGVVLRERVSTQELRADGAALSECAGGYTKHVIAGKSLVFGTYVDGSLVGNVECVGPEGPRFGPKEGPFALVQNQGWKNTEPHPKVKAVEQGLVQALQRIPEHRVAAYSAGLDAAREGWRHPDGVSEDAGYDVSNKANIRRAFEAFAAYKVLPPRHAEMGFDRWMGTVVAREVEALRLNDLDGEARAPVASQTTPEKALSPSREAWER